MEIQSDDGYTTDTDDDNNLDQEELEIALYSQIHFEDNDKNGLPVFTNTDNVLYEIKVDGNNKTGFVSDKTTSDLILNKQLKEKYKEDLCTSLYESARTDRNEPQNTVKQISTTNIDKAKKDNNETFTKLKKEKQSKERQDKTKPSLAEKLMLGDDSDSVSEIVVIDDSDDDDDDDYKVKHDNKVKKKGKFIDAYSDDSEGDNYDNLNPESDDDSTDILFNILGGKLPSSSSELGESTNDEDWKISIEDSKLVTKNRYFKPVVCFNCGERGHISKSCPKPKKQIVCSICSETGHSYRNCTDYFCSNCLELGHTVRKCRMPWRVKDTTCYRCKMVGHESQKCPDQWRQYHLTIKPGKLIKGKPRQNVTVSCYNCGGDDHLGHECDEERMNEHVCLTSPYIHQYKLNKVHKELVMSETRDDTLEEYNHPPKKQKTVGSLINGGKLSSYVPYSNKRHVNNDRSDLRSVYSGRNNNNRGGSTTNNKININRVSIGMDITDMSASNKKGKLDKKWRQKVNKQIRGENFTESYTDIVQNVQGVKGNKRKKKNQHKRDNYSRVDETVIVNAVKNTRGFRTKLNSLNYTNAPSSKREKFQDIRITIQNDGPGKSTVTSRQNVNNNRARLTATGSQYHKAGKKNWKKKW